MDKGSNSCEQCVRLCFKMFKIPAGPKLFCWPAIETVIYCCKVTFIAFLHSNGLYFKTQFRSMEISQFRVAENLHNSFVYSLQDGDLDMNVSDQKYFLVKLKMEKFLNISMVSVIR